MEREQIIKALECCIDIADKCNECPCLNSGHRLCIDVMAENALALIKELTAKTEAQDIVIAKLRKKLGKAEHDADRYANRINELNAEVSVKKKLLIKSSDLVERIQADTVRKMQERLKDGHTTAVNPNVICLYESELDQIAKEMLEEK